MFVALFGMGCFSKNSYLGEFSFGATVFIVFLAHQATKWLIAFEASRQLSEDRFHGSLELIRVTPLTASGILQGQWLALRQAFIEPLVILVILNVILAFLCVFAAPVGLLGAYTRLVMLEICLGGTLMLLVDFHALGWVGMWLALSAPRHSRAIVSTLARVMLAPWAAIVLLILLTMGGNFLSGEVIPWFVMFWFGLAAMIELVFAKRAKEDVTRVLQDNLYIFQGQLAGGGQNQYAPPP
jgi:hypothetical protein